MIVAADVDGTLTSGETWRAVGRYLAEHGRARAYRAFFLTPLPGALLRAWTDRLSDERVASSGNLRGKMAPYQVRVLTPAL